MPVICRLLAQPATQAVQLPSQPEQLASAVESARTYTDVYRYWHGIEFLLAQHQPESFSARWLALGQPVSPSTSRVPAARIIAAPDAVRLAGELGQIAPEDLAPHYDGAALDQAGIYPRKWQEWEETFDPLGQVLEHYSFLQSIAKTCAQAGDALLLYFVDDGDED
jgi:hypothetical protein